MKRYAARGDMTVEPYGEYVRYSDIPDCSKCGKTQWDKNHQIMRDALERIYNSTTDDDDYRLSKVALEQISQPPDDNGGWVSVKNRLPDVRSKYWVLTEDGWQGQSSYYGDSVDGGWGVGHVTHWRPLPSPPKEG